MRLPLRAGFASAATEAILIAMACLSPWALGSRQAWAQLALACGVFLLAVLRALAGWRTGDGRGVSNWPSLALLGLVGLALIQALPVGEKVLRTVSRPSASLRARLIPARPERVIGDDNPPVPLPPPTLSQYPEATSLMAGRLAALWVVFQSVMGLRRGSGAFGRFATAIAVNSTLLALFSVVQGLNWNGKIFGLYPAPSGNAGPFLNHNALAAAMNLGLGLALGVILGPRLAKTRGGARAFSPLAWYVVGVVTVGVLASLSRVGFLSLAATVAAAACVVIRRGNFRAVLISVAAAVAVPAVLLVALGGVDRYHERLATILQSSAYEARFRIWKDVVHAWPVYPVWGTGLGSFPVAHVPFLTHDTSGTVYNHAENEYIEWLVEGGLLGVGMLLVLPLGTAGAARSAFKSGLPSRDRGLVLGAVFALFSLTVHSVSDFALHTPPVALSAAILSAFVCKAGIDSRGVGGETPTRTLLIPSALAWLALPGFAAAVVVQHYALTRAEAALAPVRLTELDVYAKAGDDPSRPGPPTGDVVRSLDEALGERPDWAQGHVMLAGALIRLYEESAADAIDESVKDARLKAAYANPLWFHRQYHQTPRGARETAEELLAYEPIARFLVPAALELLEARRCCPVMAIPHAELASLDYLLVGGDPVEVYLERAYELAGSKTPVLEQVAQIATQTDDLDLAGKCWRSLLRTNPSEWSRYARVAGSLLPPERVLDRVVPDGRLAVLFADELYTAPEDDQVRRRYYAEALRRLPADATVTTAERLEIESRAWQGLGDGGRATKALTRALGLEPLRSPWRKALVDALIDRGLLEEAYDQALVGVHLTPQDPLAQTTFNRSMELLARGKAAGGRQGGPSPDRPRAEPGNRN